MPIDPITPGAVAPNQPANAKKTDLAAPAKLQAGDKVAQRDERFPFAVYAKHTLDQLRSLVQSVSDGFNLDEFDPSPDAVSDTIAGFAVGMFGAYREQHPELSDDEAINKYEKLIGNAVNKGYNEALAILQGMDINDENTMGQIQQTHNLIFEKLDRFFTEQRDLVAQQNSDKADVIL
ncbi:MAG: DUF5610 domain-containing protein [Candidatus Lernaella stagnicola]|nr:DUF5610 domain-containing protein [Candidatus Lernaella stagnicola]